MIDAANHVYKPTKRERKENAQTGASQVPSHGAGLDEPEKPTGMKRENMPAQLRAQRRIVVRIVPNAFAGNADTNRT